MDDFGTGYSSLLHLPRYPINSLKIVGATWVAEGVETMDQYAALRAMGCDQGQGHLWSPAVPISDLPTALQACRCVPTPPTSAPRPRRGAAVPEPAPELTAAFARMQSEGASTPSPQH